MWKIVLLFAALYSPAIAQVRGPIVWGNNNNALYLPNNKPTVGSSCLTVDPLGIISPQTCGGGGGSGTVTSIAAGTLPSWLVWTGLPITTSGNIGLATPSQTANKFLASPNGGSGALSPRLIVAADIPTLNQNSTGSAHSLDSTFASGQPLFGNGTGIPIVGSKSGLTNEIATVSGALVAGHGLQVGLNGDLIDTGNPVGQAAGVDQSIQFKGADGNFHGDTFFKYDYGTHTEYIPQIVYGSGVNQPAGFDNNNKLEPWARTGSHKTLVNTDDVPIQPGVCYAFDSNGNFVSTGVVCTPTVQTVYNPIVVTTDYSPLTTAQFVITSCAALCTVTLPDISSLNGFRVSMKNVGPANSVLHNFVGQLIDGQNDWGLLPDKSQVNLIAVGGQWYVF